jgi:hypothetical protein
MDAVCLNCEQEIVPIFILGEDPQECAEACRCPFCRGITYRTTGENIVCFVPSLQ